MYENLWDIEQGKGLECERTCGTFRKRKKFECTRIRETFNRDKIETENM